MAKFSETGGDVVLCQVCGRDIDTSIEEPEWRVDITGCSSAGNVCPQCIKKYDAAQATKHVTTGYDNEQIAEGLTILPLQRKKIATAAHGKTELGYDLLIIHFTDGTSLRVREEGQEGEFSIEVK